ncbi:hypothetical protein [Pedobacter gandavensis]|uniref:hypothetical protein n=1 Tax=Pedobacter gandavensis TaxID=2679963 RepID=UPI00292F8133|nr:hypothetical protein [Pedobacter gandavensis]
MQPIVKLKQLVADLSLDKHMLQVILKKKVLRPGQLKRLAEALVAGDKVSVNGACAVTKFCRSMW